MTEGDIAEIRFFIEEGYTLGTLKVLSNGEELTITAEDEYAYKATFKPKKDFAITFTGAVAPKVANVRLAVGDMLYPSYHDRIMVEIFDTRFEFIDTNYCSKLIGVAEKQSCNKSPRTTEIQNR